MHILVLKIFQSINTIIKALNYDPKNQNLHFNLAFFLVKISASKSCRTISKDEIWL